MSFLRSRRSKTGSPVLDHYASSVIGGRKDNQDAFGSWRPPDGGGEGGVFVVADGLGGHRGGADASRIAVETFLAEAERRQGGHEWIADAIEAANAAIVAYGEQNPEVDTLRTTVVVLVLAGETAYWGHVGDSRLYHLHNHKIIERTQDDSVVEVLRITGEISEDEMRHHCDRNRVLRTLGDAEGVKIRLQQEGHALQSGDRFLLCTDGVWERYPREMLEAISKTCPTSQAFVEKLLAWDGADQDEDADNATALVVTASKG